MQYGSVPPGLSQAVGGIKHIIAIDLVLVCLTFEIHRNQMDELG